MRYEQLAPHHAARVFHELQDAALYAFIPDERPASIAALEARYARLAAGGPPGEVWLNWIAFDDRDSLPAGSAAGGRRGVVEGGVPVGTLQATIYPHARADVAWVVFPRHWRRGHGTAMAAWLLAQLAELGVARAEAAIDPRNRASLALAAKLGFEPAGARGGDAVLVKRLG